MGAKTNRSCEDCWFYRKPFPWIYTYCNHKDREHLFAHDELVKHCRGVNWQSKYADRRRAALSQEPQ